MTARIGIGGLWHETNTFVPGRTTLADFRAGTLAVGSAELAELFEGTATEIGGALAGCEALGLEAVPLAHAAAVPGPLVEAAARTALVELLLGQVEQAGGLDGLLLVLHGGMVAEDVDDPESDLLAQLRARLDSAPIAVVLDLHANPGSQLLEEADVVVGYETYPHVDAADRARDAVGLLWETIDGALAPLVAGRRLPLLTCPLAQATATEPMSALLATARRLRARPGVARVGLLPGFPYADVDRLGFSVVVTGEAQAANDAADEMAAAVWDARAAFAPSLDDPAAALRAAGSATGPTVLLDVADNVGAGGAGDATGLLRIALEAGLDGLAAVVRDPAAARAAAAEGVGARVELDVGSPPLRLAGRVTLAEEAAYRRSGSYMTGSHVDMGLTAVLDTGAARVVLTSSRVAPFDADHLARAGIDPASCRVLLVKSAVAWQAAFGGVAEQAFALDLGGPTTCRLETLPYSRVRRPVEPLDAVAG